jgi:hypothetical protein
VLSTTRVRDAQALLRANAYDGAYYLGGLAIENALKACIAKATQRFEFSDRQRANRVYSHDLEELLKAAGLEDRLRSASLVIRAAWTTVKEWDVETRYRLGMPEIEVREFLRAATGRNGVLRWLRQFW